MFCYNRFHAFSDSLYLEYDFQAGWEVTDGLAFSKSKMAAKMADSYYWS